MMVLTWEGTPLGLSRVMCNSKTLIETLLLSLLLKKGDQSMSQIAVILG